MQQNNKLINPILKHDKKFKFADKLYCKNAQFVVNMLHNKDIQHSQN